MKVCKRCNIEKTLDLFHADNARKDGKSSWCKQCKYESNKEYARKRESLRIDQRNNLRDKNYKFIMEYLKKNPCVDCGETDLLVLEFDHLVGPQKKQNRVMAKASCGASLDKLMEEISKCEVRCANCHKRITYQRSKSWRFRYVQEFLG